MVPIGNIQAQDLMLHGNALFKQGQRRSRMVAGCVFSHSNLRCPLAMLSISMLRAICTGYSVLFDAHSWAVRQSRVWLLSRSADILFA